MAAWSLGSDVCNELSFPSSAPSIKRLLPPQSFTRGLNSMKSMLLLVPALRLWTPCLLGLRTYLLSSSSSPLCSPFQVFPGVCDSLSSPPFFFQVKTGGSKQLGSFPLILYPLSCFLSVAAFFLFILLSVSPNWLERNPWSAILKEGSKLWCISTHTNTQPRGLGLLNVLGILVNTAIGTYIRYPWQAHSSTHKHTGETGAPTNELLPTMKSVVLWNWSVVTFNRKLFSTVSFLKASIEAMNR